MSQFSTTHRVPHSAGEMFSLVADVERYPEFVPLCTDLVVRRRQPGEGNTEILIADMTVAYKLFNETFGSKVILDRANCHVEVENIDGPFHHLVNRWNFRSVTADSCDVEFFVSYQFASRSLQFVAGAVFDRAFRKFVDAFEQRAEKVYGPGAIAGSDSVAAS